MFSIYCHEMYDNELYTYYVEAELLQIVITRCNLS